MCNKTALGEVMKIKKMLPHCNRETQEVECLYIKGRDYIDAFVVFPYTC